MWMDSESVRLVCGQQAGDYKQILVSWECSDYLGFVLSCVAGAI
jgi:hypothetical protein